MNEPKSLIPTEEYFCPKCGAILNYQLGFNPSTDIWTCSKCGQCLYGGDIYEGEEYPNVMWFCDHCRTLLNKQSGFSDKNITWTCTECGYTNQLDTIILD